MGLSAIAGKAGFVGTEIVNVAASNKKASDLAESLRPKRMFNKTTYLTHPPPARRDALVRRKAAVEIRLTLVFDERIDVDGPTQRLRAEPGILHHLIR